MIKITLQRIITVIACICIPKLIVAQAPNLGTTAGFALFTSVGAFNNNGASVVTGDVGTNAGAFTAFPTGTLVGQIYVVDAVSLQAASDLDIAVTDLNTRSEERRVGK